jgi:hypothetical protein
MASNRSVRFIHQFVKPERMFLSNWNSQSSQSVTQLQTDLMRKQTSLRTTQSASSRERFLLFRAEDRSGDGERQTDCRR